MPGLTREGFDALRTRDYLDLIRDDYEGQIAEEGYPAPDWDSDLVLGVLSAIMAGLLGDTAGEATQALYDAFDVNAATGVQLSNLARIVGVTRKKATYSRATVTLTGTAGTIVVEGVLVEGGGVDDRARWETTETVTIAAGGTVDVIVQAEEPGRIEAAIGAIDKVATLVSGLDSVTNAAAAVPGDDAESDDELRKRRQESLQIAGGRSLNALRANLLELDYVEACVVIDNDSAEARFVEGIHMPASSYLVVIYPSGLTTDQREEILETIYQVAPFSIEPAGTDVVGTVTALDGFEKTVKFNYATDVTADVTVTVTLESGYVLADVGPELEAAIVELLAGLGVGDPLRLLHISGLAADIEGIASATPLINGASADLVPTVTQRVIKGADPVVS